MAESSVVPANGDPVWFDNHAHLTSLKTDPAEVVADARAGGVAGLLTVGCTVEDSANAADIAEQFDEVWSTAGVHPHSAADGVDGLVELLDRPTVVAVGECGLDYHYEYSPRDAQADAFKRQISMAHERDLALVIHTREAWEHTFAILDSEGIPDRTVFHCFTGGPDEAAEGLARGAMISVSGIISFKSAVELQEAARQTPLDRLMVETDSPYLAPVPHRGKKNRPALVAIVGEHLASVKGLSATETAAATTANAIEFYRLKPPPLDDQ